MAASESRPGSPCRLGWAAARAAVRHQHRGDAGTRGRLPLFPEPTPRSPRQETTALAAAGCAGTAGWPAGPPLPAAMQVARTQQQLSPHCLGPVNRQPPSLSWRRLDDRSTTQDSWKAGRQCWACRWVAGLTGPALRQKAARTTRDRRAPRRDCGGHPRSRAAAPPSPRASPLTTQPRTDDPCGCPTRLVAGRHLQGAAAAPGGLQAADPPSSLGRRALRAIEQYE